MTTSILELTKSLEGTDVNGTLATTVESSVAQDQQTALNLTHKLTQDGDGDGLNDYEEDLCLSHRSVQSGYRRRRLSRRRRGCSTDTTRLDTNSHPGQSGTITFQDPHTVPPRQTDMFQSRIGAKLRACQWQHGNKAGGGGLPNSFVTLFIYSQPLVVVVKTDAQGHWEYLLDKSMGDGMHTVYAAETNSLGMIEARSQEFVFLKSGDSVDAYDQWQRGVNGFDYPATRKRFWFLHGFYHCSGNEHCLTDHRICRTLGFGAPGRII